MYVSPDNHCYNIFPYFVLFSGLLFIIDSNDRERMVEAREELAGILQNDEMRNVPIVVVANKQDLPSKYI